MSSAVLKAHAIVDVEDRASRQLAAIQKRVDALTKSSLAMGKAISGIGGASRNMTELSSSIGRLGDVTASVSRKTTQSMAAITSSIAGATKEMRQLAAAANAIKVPRVSVPSVGPSPRPIPATGGAGGYVVSGHPTRSPRYVGGVSVGAGGNIRAGIGFGPQSLAATIRDIAVSSAVISVGRATFEGMKDMSSQRQSAVQQGMTKEEIAHASGVANRLAHKFKATSSTENFETYLETAAISHDPRVRESVTDLFARRAQLGMNVGQTPQQVRGGQMQFMKAMDTLGMFTPDEHTGEVNMDRMRSYFESAMRVQAVEKGNLSDAMVLQTAKYLKATGAAITPEGWRRALYYAAEAGSSGANEANRMMTTFSGTAKKETIPKLIEDGFMEADGQRKTKKGKPGAYYGLRPADEDAANADPRAWAAEKVVAAMKKHGLDPNDKNEVVKYVRSLGTNQQVSNYLIKAATQRMEAERQLQQAERVKVDEKSAIEGQKASINSGLEAIHSRVKDIGSAVDDKGGGLVNAGLGHIEQRLDAIAQFIRDPSSKNGMDAGQTAAEIAALIVAKMGLTKLMEGGGLAGSATALTGSATELIGAARALDAAAARLGGSNLPGGLKGAPAGAAAAPVAAASSLPVFATIGTGVGGIAVIAAVGAERGDMAGAVPGGAPVAGGGMPKPWMPLPGKSPIIDLPAPTAENMASAGQANRDWNSFHGEGFKPRDNSPDMASLLSGRITAKVDGPIPVEGTGELTLTINVNASDSLKADISSVKRSISLLFSNSGVGPTGHSKSSLGVSMPEAGPGSNR